MKKMCWIVPLITVGVSLLGGYFSQSGMEWYRTLVLPSITPPDWVFSFVWTFIFILTTIAVMMTCSCMERSRRFYGIMMLFGLNAVANVAWSFLFFFLHKPFIALLDAIFIECTVVALMYFLYPFSRVAVVLLMPYAVWVVFAIYLNLLIVQLN